MDNQNTQKSKRAQVEEAVLVLWQEKNIFQKTLEKESPKGDFVFYEGPPTANGKPGIHHLEARAFKDAIPRYKTMQGYHVRRKGGWDTHGLPVELQVEKELGLKSKKEVEGYGVAEFNKKCKESVWQYLDVWNKFTHRTGYWVDQENPYVTYHNSYIESVWNVVGQVHAKNLLYKDYKVVPWCPRCGTALSSHELAQGYEDVKDLSVYAKFKITDEENTYILAWTTTPWTLPGNVALAVGKDIEYVKIKVDTKNVKYVSGIVKDGVETHQDIVDSGVYILAEARLSVINFEYEIIEKLTGSDLIGLEYEPLYPYLKDAILKDEAYAESRDKAFKVYGADFVTTTDGTGVVHTAVMYGQDDFELGTTLGLPKFHTVDVTGNFVSGTDFLEGRFVKDEAVAIDIIKDLAHRGLLFKKEKYEHSYPHCWRCKTPLIYYARDSWYIRMSQLREQLVDENQYINWEPAYIRDGRFGEWLKDIKDWAISRERYWGTPLPIWEKETGERVVVDSLEALKKYTKKSGNTYFVMRHGEAEQNIKGVISQVADAPDHLTPLGKEQVETTADILKQESIDMIVVSPFVRTQETAEIVRNICGLSSDAVIVDERLHEMKIGDVSFTTWTEYHNERPKTAENFIHAYPNGESYSDVKKRVMDVVYEYEKNYSHKKILFITHGGPAWLMQAGVLGYTPEESLKMVTDKKDFHYLGTGQHFALPFVPLPHNELYELDLHKPYIDDVQLVDEQGVSLTRVKEVMDVWFDSGCMPFAQDHYPFSTQQVAYPADFISEAIDQTRGWFYTLHAVGILTGKGKAYKNVICLGHILDSEGKKMSKSLGNIVDPWVMMEKYGVDPLRFWMYTVNQPGEPKNFDEKTVLEITRKVFTLLENVITFYELYRDTGVETNKIPDSSHVLDVWILTKLNILTREMTEKLEVYKLLEPGRAFRDFIDDLSTWYLRRSRERLKEGDKDAKKTLYYVLKTLSKLCAPFTPFLAEEIYQKLRLETDPESVHLESWPEAGTGDESVLERMSDVRTLVTLGLQARQKAGIPVRQPLLSVALKTGAMEKEYSDIMEDELNVKEILCDENQNEDVILNTEITPELKAEGAVREFIRAVQDMRKKKGLEPADEITLTLSTDEQGQNLLKQFKDEIKKTVGAKDIVFGDVNGEEVVINEYTFVVQL